MRNFFVRDKAFYRSFLALSGALMLEQAVVLCVNLAAGKKYGVMFPFAMIFFHWQFLGGFGFPYVLLKISPVSLANLMLLDPDAKTVFPSHSYALIFFLTGIALCVVLALRLIRRKPLTASRA